MRASLAARRALAIAVTVVVALVLTRCSFAEPAEAPAAESAAVDMPPPLTHYMGREIAQTMHFLGAPWLVRDSRDREEDCATMLAELGVRPGQVVCDMGCGNGFYTVRLAELTGDEGKVFAVDIQPEMLTLLRERCREADCTNVKPVLGAVVDARLPKQSVDLILLVDVYHEFSHPEQMLSTMREALARGGRLVLVEFRLEDPDVPIKLLHKMSKAQINKELSANGYRLVREFDGLPWQHMMFFEALPDETGETRGE